MFAAPQSVPAVHPGGVGELAHVVLGLLLVLAVLLALAALARRVRGPGPDASRSLQVVANVALGSKERAVLVRVGGTQLLLGVAPGRVSTLHVLAEPQPAEAPESAGPPAVPSFRALLRRSLGV